MIGLTLLFEAISRDDLKNERTDRVYDSEFIHFTVPDKIEHIKKTMSEFTLPAPSWAKGIDSDNELKKLLEKLKSK